MGVKGPKTILEGDKGFLGATADKINFAAIRSKLGKRYEILNSYTKLYPSCRHTHVAIDLILSLRKNRSLAPEDVKSILVRTHKIGLSETGKILAPESPQAALFSMPYSVAVALIEGRVSLDDFTEEKIRNEAILRLAKKVRVKLGPEFERIYPKGRGAEVTVILRDGSKLTERKNLAKGEPEDPATDEELREKFMQCSDTLLSKERTQHVIDTIYNVEKLHHVGELLGLLKPETP